MTLKNRFKQAFKNHVLKPQLIRSDAWKKMVMDIPEATRGGENSPVRFYIPEEGIKMEGGYPPVHFM